MKSSTRMLRVHFLLRQFARLTDLDLETCETLREGDEKGESIDLNRGGKKSAPISVSAFHRKVIRVES